MCEGMFQIMELKRSKRYPACSPKLLLLAEGFLSGTPIKVTSQFFHDVKFIFLNAIGLS
jgi:hypothetical protein